MNVNRDYDAEFLKTIAAFGDNIFNFLAEIKYTGLDTNVTYAKLLSLEKNTTVLNADMLQILVFIDERGVRFDRDKVKQRMNTKGKEKIQKLMQKYGVTFKSPTSPEDITLPRIQATFAHLMANWRFVRLTKTQNHRTVGEVVYQSLVPILFSGGAALIPKDNRYDELFEAYVSWAISFDEVIKGEKAQKTEQKPSATGKKPDPQAVRRYAEIAREQSPTSDKFRMNVLMAVGIISTDGSYQL